MRFTNEEGTVSHFDSVYSMANIQVPECNMEIYRNLVNRYKENQEDWLGVENLSQLKEIVELYGWKKGVKKGKNIIEQITVPKLPSVKRRKKWGASGQMLNISRMYSGNVNKAWRSTYKELSEGVRAKRSPVTLVIDLCTSAWETSDSFFWRGALGTVLARALQKSGRNVRIIAASRIKNDLESYRGSSTKDRQHIVLLDVKPYGQMVEFNTMFSVTALAGFFRYYFFKAYLSINASLSSGIGSVEKISEGDLDFLDDGNPMIVIENIWNEESALRKAKNLLDEI